MKLKLAKISRAICFEVIEKYTNSDEFMITSITEEKLQNICGYLGDYSTIIMKFEKNGVIETCKFFAKFLPTNENQRNIALEMNAFVKEEFFYTILRNQLKQSSINMDTVIPQCLFANKEMLILEDLTLEGFRTLPSRQPLPMDYVKAALAALAKLHTSGLIFEKLTSTRLDTFFPKVSANQCDVIKNAVESIRLGINALIDLTSNGNFKLSKEILKLKASKSLNMWEIYTKPSIQFKNTICHGDPWCNNFMFKFEETVKCTIVDFQSYRYVPPAQDVMVFLHFTTRKQFRDKHLQKMLLFYYNELDKNFRKCGQHSDISVNEFFRSCSYFEEFALIQTVSRLQTVAMSNSTAQTLMNMKGMDRYKFTVNLCQNDSIYKTINIEAITELCQFYEKVD